MFETHDGDAKRISQINFTLAVVSCCALLIMFLVGCQSNDKNEKKSETSDLTPVQVQLSWTHNSEFAPLYMAEAVGYYTQEKIQPEFVSVLDAQGNILNPIDEVVAGRAQFGIADAGTLLLARSQGKPVVAVAALYQHHPMAVVSLAGQNITRPEDLIGKTVQVNASTEQIFYALLASRGIDPSEINIVQRTDLTIAALTEETTDALTAWVTNEVVALKLEEIPFNSFLAYEYGVDLYPNLIFTSEALIKDNPTLVQGFVTATIGGINTTLTQREQAVELAIAHDASLNADVERLTIAESVPLWLPEGAMTGEMTAENWELMHLMMVEQGILSEPIDYTTAYDLTFLNAFYRR